MILQAIENQLLNRGFENIFISFKPDQPNNLITIMSVNSQAPDIKYGYDRPIIELIVRGTEYAETEQRAWNVYRSLQGYRSVLYSGIYIVDMQATITPELIRYDTVHRPEFNLLFITEIQDENVLYRL